MKRPRALICGRLLTAEQSKRLSSMSKQSREEFIAALALELRTLQAATQVPEPVGASESDEEIEARLWTDRA